MFAQITKSYCKQVRTYPTDKLMIGYKEKFKLHLLNKHKEKKKKKGKLNRNVTHYYDKVNDKMAL